VHTGPGTIGLTFQVVHEDEELITTVEALPSLSERIASAEQAQTVFQYASVLSNKGDFMGAISLYDRLLAEAQHLTNPYKVREVRAIAYCEAGQFAEAEQALRELQDALGPVGSEELRYWQLVAQHKGNKSKAMEEFVKPSG
jgi:tetratricopeptide (TPR) repeat protein